MTTASTSETQSLHGTNLAASLTVKDVPTSVAWYRDVLGFSIDREHERGGQLIAVSLRAGAVRILLGRDDGAKGLDRVKGEGFSLQISTTQNIDEIAARIKAHGGTLATEPVTMPWGPRVFRIVDPDGFKLTFSSDA
jgi:uncharacterized glyoxalase superfamily protein PhnB